MPKTLIIAEAGVNHNGDIKIAERLVDAAAESGADMIKFQTFRAGALVCKDAAKAAYQIENTGNAETQYDMLKKLELTYEMHIRLIEYCTKKKIIFFSAPFDIESIHLLEKLQMPCYKIPSGDINNYPYLQAIGRTKKPIILSTGMSTLPEVMECLSVLRNAGTPEISVLHCNTQYPTPVDNVNLDVIPALKKKLNIRIGYSDHTEGIEIPIAAVALGAEIIEKHFTLDKNMDGPDHKASLEPDELKAMVKSIRNVECAIGSADKSVTNSETENRILVRKSIVAKNRILKGELFTENNLTTKRPGNGISPMKWLDILGTRADRDYQEDSLIEFPTLDKHEK